jgi:hypothetical protein
MVAITILAVMILLFGQMLAISSKMWIYGHGRANNFTKARAMLELFAQDIQSGVFRPDLAAFPTSGTYEFYTTRKGIPSTTQASSNIRSISVVQYIFTPPLPYTGGVMPNSLSRADSAILWSDEANNPVFQSASTSFGSNTPSPRDTAPGVVDFTLYFIQADGSMSTIYQPLTLAGVANPSPPTRAILVSLAVIDDLVTPKMGAKINTLYSGLNGAIASPPTKSIKAYWDAYLNGTINWTSYPKGLGASLATFERYVTLPTSP